MPMSPEHDTSNNYKTSEQIYYTGEHGRDDDEGRVPITSFDKGAIQVHSSIKSKYLFSLFLIHNDFLSQATMAFPINRNPFR